MARKRHLLVVERLEQRQLLTAVPWFEDSGQALGSDHTALELGDLDGDGDLDAFLGCWGFATLPTSCSETQVWLNNGSGQFSKGWSDRVTTGALVALSDLDIDGDLDAFFVKATASCEASEVWLNDGQGNFEDSGQRLNGCDIDVGLGDVDGDGDLDAVVGNGGSFFTVRGQANDIWLNDGSGVFTLAQELGDTATTKVALGDIDNDGDLDALFANLGQANQVWFNTQLGAGDSNRDGVFNQLDIVQVLQAAKYQTGQPATWAEGDFNRDGVFDQLDIVAALQTGKYGQV